MNHPASNLFPLLRGEPFDALVRDIKEHGQQEPIYRFGGKILDGRNRLRACEKLGVEPWFEDLTKDQCPDPFAMVMSLNFHRRHLEQKESGKVLAAYRDHLIAQNPTRSRGRPKSVSAAEIGRAVGIPERTVRDHLKAHDDYQALPRELKRRVDSGEVTPAVAKKAADHVRRHRERAERNGAATLPRASQEVIDKAAERAKREAKFYRFMDNTTDGLESWLNFASNNRWGEQVAASLRSQIGRCERVLTALRKALR